VTAWTEPAEVKEGIEEGKMILVKLLSRDWEEREEGFRI
jgi:hypothetical protein